MRITFYSFLICLLANMSFAVELFAYRSDDNKRTVVSDAYASTKAVEFGFIISDPAGFNGEIIYLKDGQERAKVPVLINAGSRFIFPNEENLIVLEEPGVHTFQVKENGKFADQRSVLIFPKQDLDIKKANVQFSMKNPGAHQARTLTYEKNIVPKVITSEVDRGLGSEIYKSKVKSVVLIVAGEGMGTGSIIDQDGLVLTNWHVLGDKKQVAILFKPEGFGSIEVAENYIGDVIKVDKTKDLALLKIRAFDKVISPIELASVADIEIAENVHAIGHPKGNFWTYTRGVISQIRPSYEWKTNDKLSHQADVIQTQTPINPGNSGGPLLNDEGLMVGVNSFVDIESDGLNYAVAATAVIEFINSKQVIDQKAQQSQPAKLNATEQDRNSDGQTDLWGYDQNGNGIFDRFDVDNDFDGRVDQVIIDENENEIAERTIRFADTEDGTIAIITFDDDEDGNPDEIGYDFDLDGELDKVEPA